jgi:hypothetical protein
MRRYGVTSRFALGVALGQRGLARVSPAGPPTVPPRTRGGGGHEVPDHRSAAGAPVRSGGSGV